jgi:hypothetical protein
VIKTFHFESGNVKHLSRKEKNPKIQLSWISELYIFLDPSPREFNIKSIRIKLKKTETLQRNILLISNLWNKVNNQIILDIF